MYRDLLFSPIRLVMQRYPVVLPLAILTGFFLWSGSSIAQQSEVWKSLFSSAYFHCQGYEVLRSMSDKAGPRVMGTSGNEAGLQILADALRGLGFQPRFEKFPITGWERGDDDLTVITPFRRRLRCAALGFTDQTLEFTSRVVDAGYGYAEDYAGLDVRNAIVLVTQERAPNRAELLRYEALDIAASNGAKAILFINEKSGGQLLAGAGNFHGTPTRIPAFSITLEEGLWLRRLSKAGTPAELSVTTRSRCFKTEIANLVATLPGRDSRTIVLGAHVDTWDIGLGGVDNGQGSAVLFDLARLLKKESPVNAHTVEFVWFNGEELGLHGAKQYALAHEADPILAMINMDMTGSPQGFNAMGFDEFVPFFQGIATRFNGLELPNGVSNTPWTNSDHVPFIMKGIPSLSIHGKLEEPMYKYYHDFGDSFDKISKRYVSDAAAVISIVAYELANAPDSLFRRRSREEIIALWRKHKLDERLKKQKEWDLE